MCECVRGSVGGKRERGGGVGREVEGYMPVSESVFLCVCLFVLSISADPFPEKNESTFP